MHTPEQAKDLWCPMARVARDESIEIERAAIGDMVHVTEQRHIVGGCNRDALGGFGAGINSCNCIADQCAMWRWEPTTESVPTVTEGASGMQARTYKQVTTRTHGYCGIAGHPVLAF